MKKINKIGSHVGMVISFVVFVTFLVFLFIIFRPWLNADEEKESLLDNIEINFLDYLASDLTTISLHIDSGKSLNQNCVEFDQVSALAETGFNGSNVAVKNSAGSNLGFEWKETQSDLLVASDKSNRFFKIYASEAIESSESAFSGCDSIGLNDYDTGLAKTEKNIFEQNTLDAIELYKTDYDLLKNNIGIGTGEFGLDFIYENGTILSLGESSQKAGIYTKEASFYYLERNLNTNVGNMIIKTW